MRRLILVAVVALLACASVAVAAGGANVKTRNTGLGKIIVNGKGVTLYLFEKDSKTRSRCTGQCASAWPPLTTKGRPVASGGVKQSHLGTIKRAGGARQVTYFGHPLYTYVGDGGTPGRTNGNGSKAFGAEWYAMHTNGKKAED